jgi:hypothetical protein
VRLERERQSDDSGDVLPQRLMDYFVVFSAKVPEKLTGKSSEDVFSLDEVDKLVAEVRYCAKTGHWVHFFGHRWARGAIVWATHLERIE